MPRRATTTNTAGRAALVIDHYRQMAIHGPRHRDGELTNPLASREHDNCWEMGDGEAVAALVVARFEPDPGLAWIIVHDENVRRYVPNQIKAAAEAILAAYSKPARPVISHGCAPVHTEPVNLANGAFALALVPGVAPFDQTAEAIAQERKARTLRRLHLPLPEGSLWDETECDSQALI